MSNHEFTSDKKKKTDEYYTRDYAIIPILKYLEKGKTIWCPFDTEESNYVKIFRSCGFKVVATHIDNGEDFFSFPIGNLPLCDYIISNPPYSLRERVLEKLFLIGKPFAMLINISGLFDSRKRFELFKNNPFEIMVFNKRIDYIKPFQDNKSSPPFSSIYLCSGLLPDKFVFEELDKTQSFPHHTLASPTFPTEKAINMGDKVTPSASPKEATLPSHHPNIMWLRPNFIFYSKEVFN